DVLNAAEKEAVIVLQASPDVVRFAPSLVIDDAEIDEGLERFERAVAKLVRG
ncbi:bifunctional succinylornithine transaminase/acetylornithine transaminase, partial [Pseudomonas aeruginosa]